MFMGPGGGQNPLFSARQNLQRNKTSASTVSLIIGAFYAEGRSQVKCFVMLLTGNFTPYREMTLLVRMRFFAN
jgi:hypothetical protein